MDKQHFIERALELKPRLPSMSGSATFAVRVSRDLEELIDQVVEVTNLLPSDVLRVALDLGFRQLSFPAEYGQPETHISIVPPEASDEET